MLISDAKLDTFCIFCGKRPKDKTKEHILPKWLIETTGDKARIANLGLSFVSFEYRKFSFSQFTFPACCKCNNQFATLEAKAKHVIKDILEKKDISSEDLSLLLDWFDKVRIGLWLGMNVLNKNVTLIEPKFHIASRIGKHDRLLIVQKSDYKGKRLNFGGADTFSFGLCPSAFVLIINNYYFTNISCDYLFSKRLGFPFPKNKKVADDKDGFYADFERGTERVMLPIIRKKIENTPVFYQPMFPLHNGNNDIKELYETDYVKKHSISSENGVGNIFLQKEHEYTEYTSGETVSIEANIEEEDDDELFIKSAINIYVWQNWLNSQIPSLEKLDDEQKRFVKSRFSTAKTMNNYLIKNHKEDLKKQKQILRISKKIIDGF